MRSISPSSSAKAPARPGPAAFARGNLFAVLMLPMLGINVCQDGNYVLNPAAAPEPPTLANLVETQPPDAQWDLMTASLRDLAGKYRGSVGIYLKDLNSDKVWEYNPDQLFPSASLVKVPIMVSVCEKIKQGELTLDTKLKLTSRDKVDGSGTLKWARSGTRLSVLQVLFKMITESDNTATRMLISNSGFGYLQRAFAALGLVHTNIGPEGMTLRSGRVARENYTTPREMAGLLERIYRGELIDKEASEFMLEVLKHNKNRSRLRKAFPPGWELGRKTGLLRRSCHDVAIVYAPRGNYILAVLTADTPDYHSAMRFITRVGQLTYQYYQVNPNVATANNTAAPAAQSI